LGIKIFSKCGITPILFPLMLALFFMMGCIDKGPQLSQVPSFGAEEAYVGELSSHLQIDFVADVKSDLFCARGKVLLMGNGSLPYLMLNATLAGDGGSPLTRTKYLLMQLEPNRDYSFDISKNMRIQPGDYNCTIEASGPRGTLACESRKCSLAKPQQDSISRTESLSVDAELAQQRAREERARDESSETLETARRETSKEVVAEKSATSRAGNAAKDGAAKKDDSVGTMTSSEEKENGEESLPVETVDVENDTSGGKPMPVSSSMDASKATLVGSSTSKKYHRWDCRYVAKIKPENRINFTSPEDAKRQGYLPCKSCNP
jgi:hypothetical protein